MPQRIPALINGRPCFLAVDFAALYALKQKYDLDFEQLVELQKARAGKSWDDAEGLGLLMKLLFCMTRSMDDPPTEKEIERMSLEEIVLLRSAIPQAVRAWTEPIVGESPAAAPAPGVGGGRSGTGGGRSSRRSTGSSSRRRRSGG